MRSDALYLEDILDAIEAITSMCAERPAYKKALAKKTPPPTPSED